MAADPWADLTAELDAWAAAGRAASFWWRDDDATAPSPALDRLLGRAEACGVPLALAVIPATAGPALGDRLAAAPAGIRVLVHGWSHGNHARPDKKKSELACGRPMAEMTADLARGRTRLDKLFGPRLLPVLTPPWNRLPAPLIRELPAIGIDGLSRFKPRKTRTPAPGVVEVNTHIDPIDWHGGRGFTGEVAALGAIAAHLAARRTGRVDPTEPTGLLTHHLVHDQALDGFLDRLMAHFAAHPAVIWPDLQTVFAA